MEIEPIGKSYIIFHPAVIDTTSNVCYFDEASIIIYRIRETPYGKMYCYVRFMFFLINKDLPTHDILLNPIIFAPRTASREPFVYRDINAFVHQEYIIIYIIYV